jgi:hypothetical protein
METKMERIETRLDEQGRDIKYIIKKLDTTFLQTVYNAEQQYQLNELTSRVTKIDDDLKVVKRVLTIREEPE